MRRWLVAAAGVLALGTFVPTAYADPVELQGPSIAPVGSNVVVSVVFANPGSSLWFSSFKIESSAPLVSVTTTSNVRCFNFITFINCTATLVSAGETGSATVVVGPIPAGATTVTAGGTSTSGPYSLTKVINGLVPGVPTELAFTTQPSNAIAGAAISPAVQVSVRDAFGDVVADASGSITIGLGSNPGGSTLSGTTSVTPVNGIATFSDLSLDKAGSGYTLAASAAGLTSATSNTFNVTPGTAAQLSFAVQPSDTAAGSAIAPAVQVALLDAFGNVTSATDNVSIALAANPGGSTLAGTTTAAAVGGVATFADLSLNKIGAGYTLAANVAGLTTITSNAFAVSPGPAAQLVFLVQPSNAVVGAAVTPAVQVGVQDAFGNPTTANGTVTLTLATNPGGAALAGATALALNGVAVFSNLALDRAGTGYTLGASALGLAGATSASFDVADLPADGKIAVRPPVLTFGAVSIGESGGRRLTIANVGTVPVGLRYTLSGADAGAFTITPQASSIAPGWSTAYAIEFRPSKPGSATAVLALTGNFGRVEVRLKGRGLASRFQ